MSRTDLLKGKRYHIFLGDVTRFKPTSVTHTAHTLSLLYNQLGYRIILILCALHYVSLISSNTVFYRDPMSLNRNRNRIVSAFTVPAHDVGFGQRFT